ncbi:MAG: HAMP domain-containing histidine kinase [Burkholderiales bacterium]|nr:HAMP domain-containing histidine kinase [Burkholderiales bacterium]
MLPRPSLRWHFVLWLGVGAIACLSAAAGWRFAQVQRGYAQAQDQRLAARMAAWPLEAQPLPLRVSRTDGEKLRGEADLAPYPWARDLRPGEAPRFYFTHIRGELMRAAAASRSDGAQAVVLQMAEPLAGRLPSWQDFWSGALPAFAGGLMCMLAIAACASALARRWVVRSLRGFGQDGASPAPCPEELQPALARVRELHDSERLWVEQQRRFLADAAHQLRTPMAVLRTQLQAALETDAGGRDALAGMLHTVDRATGLANQLLSLTRLEQLRNAGALQPLPVAPAVREAVVELSPLISRKRLEFALEGPDFSARGDAVMLGELLRNLLANAIHYSPPGSAMGVVLRGAPPLCEIVVWDEGPGIDDEVKPRLFTPFSASKGGVGLGLSICQQIGEAMGATVHLFNRIDGGRTVGVDAVVAWKGE